MELRDNPNEYCLCGHTRGAHTFTKDGVKVVADCVHCSCSSFNLDPIRDSRVGSTTAPS